MLKNKPTKKNNRKMHIKKNDNVVVLSGESRGRKGKVLEVLSDKNQVIVEGVNLIKRHVKPNQKMGKGGILEKEGPIHASNVKIFNEDLGKVTSAVFKKLETGKKERVCKKSGDSLGS